MIPNTIKTKSLEFDSAASALEYTNSRTQQRHLISTQHLNLTKEGFLTHSGYGLKAFDGIPLTETALEQLNFVVGITKGYSKRIEPKLHALSVNDILKNMEASVTVVVSTDRDNPNNKYISAILPGGCTGIDDAIILQRLEYWGLRARVTIKSGGMQVHFGTPKTFEVLPSDHIQLLEELNNTRWSEKASTRPHLEASVFWKRLICSNGAYLRRVLGKGKLMTLASKKEAALFVDAQIKRVLSFEQDILKPAVEVMSETIPSDDEYLEVQQLITRQVGEKQAQELLSTAVSWWDEFNAVTAAANLTTNSRKSRQLQVIGGGMLERFLQN